MVHVKSLAMVVVISLFLLLLYLDVSSNMISSGYRSGLNFTILRTFDSSGKVAPVATVKPSGKWIVVTSISSPTEDVKRLATFEEWNLVVVADTKTPLDWRLEGVHFLSVEFQNSLPFSLISALPYKSYTRKNIGYLYAISQGAEWIYDTDDDNKPYGLGLNQFDYEEIVSGIRYRPQNGSSTEIRDRLFNPYRFFGMDQMWPRGFPLEHLEKHTNGKETQVLCQKMKRAAVQQGLVHHDPDVDAIYRLMHADSETGLDVMFNKFAPPITLSVGTYSPWNSQNTLFHKSAFHTLFLPTTVSFRTTDIWRSYVSQKILHLSELTVSFVPTNAVQFRNAHDYLKDYKDEKQVYEDSGKMVIYLHNWTCKMENVSDCVKLLVSDLVKQNLWGQVDADLSIRFLSDLEDLGYKFPGLVANEDPYGPSTNESSREVNCRRVSLEFELVDPKEEKSKSIRKAEHKLNLFGDVVDWCNQTGYSDLMKSFPTPKQLAESHDESYVLQKDQNNVLIVVNNYPWKYAMGLIQRLYQPYFASVIFCGSWYSDNFTHMDNFTDPIDPINYVHMNPAEMLRGYFGYHCMTLAKQIRYSNVEGYFFLADDAVFNIWQRIDFSRVHHVRGVTHANSGGWWGGEYGIEAAKRIVAAVNSSSDDKLLKTWNTFESGLREFGYIKGNETAFSQMLTGKGRSVSDFFYIPTSQINYFADLMTLFYENKFFLELAMNRFLRSVRHQTSALRDSSYLWGNRGQWHSLYNKDLDMMHPVKPSGFKEPGKARKLYCSNIMQVYADIIFGGSANFTTKGDSDEDYLNG